jgi:hypothetical protein
MWTGCGRAGKRIRKLSRHAVLWRMDYSCKAQAKPLPDGTNAQFCCAVKGVGGLISWMDADKRASLSIAVCHRM